MNKRSCWLLLLDVPIMDATDRIGSKVNWRVRVVNWIADVRFLGACVTVRIGSIVNWIVDVESWGACVGLWIAYVEVWIGDVEFLIIDDKLSVIDFKTWLEKINCN